MSRNQKVTALVVTVVGGVGALAALLGWSRLALAAIVVVGTAAALVSVLTNVQVGRLSSKQRDLLAVPAQMTKASDKLSKHLRDAVSAPAAKLADTSDQLVAAIAQARLDAAERHVELSDRLGDGVSPEAVSVRSQLDEIARTLSKNSADVRWALQKLEFEPVRQIEALQGLHDELKPVGPMPGTGGWAMNPTALRMLLRRLADVDARTVVECGSGTSSVWIGYALRAMGGHRRLVSLEHDADFAEVTRESLAAHGLLDVVEVRVAPLTEHVVEGATFSWYSPESFADLEGVDALLVDGPPSKLGPEARYPAFPLFSDKLSVGALVFLDDITRPDELAVESRWLEEFPGLERLRVQDSSMHTFVYGSPG